MSGHPELLPEPVETWAAARAEGECGWSTAPSSPSSHPGHPDGHVAVGGGVCGGGGRAAAKETVHRGGGRRHLHRYLCQKYVNFMLSVLGLVVILCLLFFQLLAVFLLLLLLLLQLLMPLLYKFSPGLPCSPSPISRPSFLGCCGCCCGCCCCCGGDCC